jgi:hypothetical protein
VNTTIVEKYCDSLGNKTNKFFIFGNQKQKERFHQAGFSIYSPLFAGRRTP